MLEASNKSPSPSSMFLIPKTKRMLDIIISGIPLSERWKDWIDVDL